MGRSDSALTPRGLKAAKQVAGIVQCQGIRTVFSSSLGRARLSAQIYTEGMGLPIHVRDAMAELCCGDWEGKRRSEVLKEEHLIRNTWQDKPPGGESYSDAETRVSQFIREITSEWVQYPVLVVAHASVNRVFLKLWSGLDAQCAIIINCPHDTVYIIEERRRIVARSVSGSQTEGFLFHLERVPSNQDRHCG